MTQDDDPKRLTDWELDQLRFSAEQRDIVDVASKDLLALVGEVADTRRRRHRSLTPLILFFPIAGTALWMVTGHWQWFTAGWLALSAAAVLGTTFGGDR